MKIKKGLDLNLEGGITSPVDVKHIMPQSVAVCPDDFPGITPRLSVKEGDLVKAGSPLFHDKTNEQLTVVSPVGGKVKAIVRGERRKIMRVVVDVDSNNAEPLTFDTRNVNNAKAITDLLLKSGMWALLRNRPYGIVPDPATTPRDIFITAIDTAPLAPDFAMLLSGKEKQLKAGVEALKQLTAGTVYVGRRNGSHIADIPGAEMVDIEGPHPAGNAGTMIANIKPVNKGENVWTLDGLTLARIGSLIINGHIDPNVTVAITGSEIEKPGYVTTIAGALIKPLIEGNIKADSRHHRIISGNVLTGIAVKEDDYLRFPYDQITVIPEGDDVDEFMGWASLSPDKMSVSRSFPGHFLHRKFAPDARLLGGRRAMIMSGEYDSVIPMDIMAEYLIKAIISRDIDKMEQLGIYEVVPEDFALAEYVDTSKLELQKIVADGLAYLRKENE
ncbi:MAG: Na(+)-translocating NADH-quinone reductase subunit A [Muribaculaceae bacterium]|nr:Na(+)-translocating NADH-quinone reductase subunit A [Muribaculaceae bacterium]